MKTIFVIAVLFIFGMSSAFALDLKRAKDKGLVGEGNDGYIVAISRSAATDVRRLIREINKIRKASYREQSIQQDIPEHIIRKRAVEKIINDIPSGHFFQDEDGSWQKR